jgi:hypothetical protein
MLIREATASEAKDPQKRQHISFWNFAHSLERSTDCRLGIWHNERPRGVVSASSRQPLAVFGWPGRSRFELALVSLDAVSRDPDLLGRGQPGDVVLARESLKPSLFAELERRFGYRPRLAGQEEGWWFYDRQPVPKVAPSARSTIALLPEATPTLGHPMRDHSESLMLIDVDDIWLVLSDAALRVYQVGAALEDGLPVHFAQWARGRRIVWQVELASPISRAMVQRRFGKEAAARARGDAKSIVVRCSRLP